MKKLSHEQLKDFLESKALLYNNSKFIESDPIQIPHLFSKKEDIEIAGFLTATIAWGNRKSIIKNANRMVELMDYSPYDFVINHTKTNLESLKSFVHRTFNGSDFITFIKALKHIYTKHKGLENVFSINNKAQSLQHTIHHFKHLFFEIDHLQRTEKHISDPLKNSAAKRINILISIIHAA